VFLVVKLTDSCIKERNYPAHPFARSRRSEVRYRQRLSEVTFHYQCLPLHSSGDRIAVDLATSDSSMTCKNAAKYSLFVR
jgi:hypothetical protein